MIADRYAEAIFSVAREHDLVDAIDADLEGIVRLMHDHPDLARLWSHPVIATADRQAIAQELLKGHVNPYTLNTLMLLFDKKRGSLIGEVQQAFRQRVDALKRRATVKVTSALPLDGASESSLRDLLAQRLAMEVTIETAVDPTLIGGVVLQIDDRVIDNSLRGRLEALRHSLV